MFCAHRGEQNKIKRRRNASSKTMKTRKVDERSSPPPTTTNKKTMTAFLFLSFFSVDVPRREVFQHVPDARHGFERRCSRDDQNTKERDAKLKKKLRFSCVEFVVVDVVVEREKESESELKRENDKENTFFSFHLLLLREEERNRRRQKNLDDGSASNPFISRQASPHRLLPPRPGTWRYVKKKESFSFLFLLSSFALVFQCFFLIETKQNKKQKTKTQTKKHRSRTPHRRRCRRARREGA